MNYLSSTSVLFKFSAGAPGPHRQDKRTTAEVKAEKSLGVNAGKWITDLFPPDCMASVKKIQNAARDYHNKVTFPFGVKKGGEEVPAEEPAAGKKRGEGRTISIAGILPKGLIFEYANRMREYRSMMDAAVGEWLANPRAYIDWAVREHNGTFDPDNYPGCEMVNGQVEFDEEAFRQAMRKRFYLVSEPLPVPDSSQFTAEINSLLGQDAGTVDLRIADAQLEAKRELIRRILEPIAAMAAKLCESPKVNAKTGLAKDDIVFRDSLVSNVKEIVELVPRMNLDGDPELDKIAAEAEAQLTRYSAEALRGDKAARTQVAESAAQIVKRLSGYKLS